MVGCSWPLWLDGSDFPRVPFSRGFPEVPAWTSRLILAAILVLLALASLGRGARVSLAGCLVLVGFEVLGDQSRLQPWVYQFLVVGLGMVIAPGAEAIRLARMYAISLYAYSGLSKLDASYVHELGPLFLGAGLSPFGISPSGWPRALVVTTVLAMPAWEVAVAAGLCTARYRRPALWGAVAQHSALLVILGPWGLGHSPNVLVWNAALIVEDWILFWPPRGQVDAPSTGKGAGIVVSLVICLVATWPAIERLGLCDSWPGHALYASHSERVEIFVHEDDSVGCPGTLRRHLGPGDIGGWRWVDLTGWSREVRGVPVYPQARVGLGIATDMVDRAGGTHPIRVVLWGRAGWLSGRRDRVECVGRLAMIRQGGRYRFNARPREGEWIP